MNRYVLSGIATDARAGKRVAIFALHRVERQEAFRALARDLEGTAQQIRRANGREAITLHNGGKVTLHAPPPRSPRGLQIDVAFVR